MNLRITSDNLGIYSKRFAIDKQGVLLVKNCLIWFRNDLRLTDNQTVNLCLANNYSVLPVYIIDESIPIGSSSRWWLKKSLGSLSKSMSGNLVIKKGDPKTILKQLIDSYDITDVCWNARYSKQELSQDNEIEEYIIKHGLILNIYHSTLLRDPSKTLKKDGTPFKVYTPFYKQKYSEFKYESYNYDIRKLQYMPTKENKDSKSVIEAAVPEENWHQKLDSIWEPGEKGANTRLDAFLSSGLQGYAEDRNRPDLPKTSMLSPHIRFGEISIRQIAESIQDDNSHDSEIFYKELVWREFSYHLLFHFPHLTHDNLQKKFDSFEWENKQKNIESWHVLYPDADLKELFLENKLIERFGYKFIWKNKQYETFNDYLNIFKSRQRKNIKNERKKISDLNITFQIKESDSLTLEDWEEFFKFYKNTYEERLQRPYLNIDFFKEIHKFKKILKPVIFFALHDDKKIAGSLCFIGNDTLYGRHWGSSFNIDSLHFETCFYQGIEFCINKKIKY